MIEIWLHHKIEKKNIAKHIKLMKMKKYDFNIINPNLKF
jgi:hypothetical protein